MKHALITGITGQDGAYLAKLLLDKGYKVFGLYRRTSSLNAWRLLNLGIFDKITLIPGDMTDMASISNAIIQAEPDEFYNLAAQSFVGTSFEQPIVTAAVDGIGVLYVLEGVKQINPKIRIYQASTSELYGNCINCEVGTSGDAPKLTEDSTLWPLSPYAASKLYAFHLVRMYREAYGMFAVNGILFNHESPLRGLEFVTRKITNAVARIKLGLQDKIQLGNIHAMRDWGYAPEFVEAMWLMLQQDEPEDFVIATGASHTVQDFLEAACQHVGLDWEEVTAIDERFKRPLEVNCLRGDSSKAKNILNWQPETSFTGLVEVMVNADMQRWTDWKNGKIFAWDAVNDSSIYQNSGK